MAVRMFEFSGHLYGGIGLVEVGDDTGEGVEGADD